MQANSNNSSQTNILSLCRYSLMINQISKDMYIHLNSRELKARHVNRRSTTQCNANSRFRYTVLFSINVQDTIKYRTFDMSGTVAKVLLTLHCFLQRQGRNFAKISQKSALYGVRLNVVIISSTLRAKE